MKTVQWWLQELDEAALEQIYWDEHPISVAEVPEECTFGTLRQKLRDFIRLLRKLPSVGSEDACVFFCGPAPYSDPGSVRTYLCTLHSLQENGKKPTLYSCIGSEWEEVLGYLVAETPFTSDHIHALIADILFEMSFMGFTPERRTETLRHLEEAAEVSWEGCVSRTAAAESLGLHPEEADPEELRLTEEINRAEIAYADYCFRRELRMLRAVLRQT